MEKVATDHRSDTLPLQRPPRPTYFTGREEELTQLQAILQPGEVVMLYGPGGVGKSTLAAELLWRLAPNDSPPEVFPDGFVYHNFYTQPQPDLAFEKFAHTFGQKAQPSPVAAAQRVLSKRKALLILDGAEVADDLSAILAVRDQCGVLITSRRPDETTNGRTISLAPVEEAVNLLQTWGGRQAADEAATLKICQLVGGLPLALRLAGSYMAHRQESATDYLAWLQNTSLPSLDQTKRQQDSVPLLLAHSIVGLSEEAQHILGIVGLLAPTSFSPDIIGVALEVSRTEAIRLLDELVSYGLLAQAAKRYLVSHTMVHTYLWRQVPISSQTIEWLASYYTVLAAEQSKLGIEGYTRLGDEREHMMATLTACNEHRAWHLAQKLAQAMDSYLNIQGHWTERMVAVQIGLTASRHLDDRAGEGIALSGVGNAFHNLGQVEQAQNYYERALAIHQEVSDLQSEEVTIGNLGLVHYSLGKINRAIGCFKRAVTIAQQVGDQRGEESWLGNLGLAYYSLGEAEQAGNAMNRP